MTNSAVGRISRISFQTDLTRGGASAIPLGCMLEAAWLDEARWLGLIGRTRLTLPEVGLVNLATWPELSNPFDLLLNRLFEQGWAAPDGSAGATIESELGRSSIFVRTEDASAFLNDFRIDADDAWLATTNSLSARLTLLGKELVPLKIPPKRSHRRSSPKVPEPALMRPGRLVRDEPRRLLAA